jgi:anti-sigma regulatory factor (Ser/Thr protein kinase)
VVRLIFETLDNDQPRALAWRPDGKLHVDLATVTWVEPYAMVTLLVAVHHAVRHGCAVAVTPPRDYAAASYCQRADLFEQLRALGVDCPDPHPANSRHDRRDTLAECVLVKDGGSVEQVMNVMMERLDASGWPAETTDALTTTVYEMGDNLITHALVNHGFAVLQTFPKKRRIQFAVGDAGVGIPYHHPGGSDPESIVHAMEYGVSSAARKRGRGFGYMTKLVSQVGGTLNVRSNGGKVIVQPTTESRSMNVWPLQGTVVAADVPLDR